jgi:quinohemoprotein ethanol dehydrogenase
MARVFVNGTARSLVRGTVLLLLLLAIGCRPADQPHDPPGNRQAGWVDSTRIANAQREAENWFMSGGGPDEQYYSELDQIDSANVAQLGFAWEYTAKSLRGRVQQGMQATPIVVDGKMFVSGPWSVAYALDAATGKELWRYDPKVDGSIARRSCCGVSSRGVQVWKGKVYLATLDGYLIALDAATGSELWRQNTFIDRDADYTITSAPHIAGTKVVIGNSGADFGVRGYVSAFDAETGAFAWRFFTVPGDPTKGFEHPELEVAAKTWDPNSTWETGLGGTVWGGMTYDPELDLLYIGTGNSSPYPIWFRSPRGGDNLYLSSIIALRPSTGRMAWYYQTVPGEIWDYTATANLVLADIALSGVRRRVLMTAPKNGFFYILDRATGEFLSAEKFVRVNWASHVDRATGRPVVTKDAWYQHEPKLVFPSNDGGHNWMPMSYSPKAGLAFIPTIDKGVIMKSATEFRFRRRVIYQGLDYSEVHELAQSLTGGKLDLLEPNEALKAWDPVTQRERWRVPLTGLFNGGVLSTAGDLVFQGRADGHLVAYRAADGSVLKDINLGTGVLAAPMTYAIAGEQYVAVAAGYGGGIGTAFPAGSAPYRYENYPRIIALKLSGGPVPLPPARAATAVPAPPPGKSDPKTIQRGEILLYQHCTYCHGGFGDTLSAYPDLTKLTPEVHDRFLDIVLRGALRSSGMAGFADVLSQDDAEAIHADLIAAQRRAFEANREH